MGGDQTQHVLWRVLNGELDFDLKPKVVVLLCGTNNTGHSAEETAEGVLACAREIGARLLPRSHIIVLGIPPRGRDPNPQRQRVARANELVEQQLKSQQPQVSFVPCPESFVNAQDGTISHTDMYDYLHLTNDGYAKFCEPLLDEINQILQQQSKE